jgi:hypothetical protein
VDHGFEGPQQQRFVEELARYGYRIVLIWVRIIRTWTRAVSVMGPHQPDLSLDDLDELAKETVARAIYSFRHDASQSPTSAQSEDATRLKTALLIQCVRQLPHAYRSMLLKAGRLVDEFEQMGEPRYELLGGSRPLRGLGTSALGTSRPCQASEAHEQRRSTADTRATAPRR